jgi:ATP-dependent DNA helicase RecG
MQRIEKDEYPVAAIREMLLNALIHRTYMGAHVQLRVYDDKLSIWNEGGLPFGLTLDELKGEHNSRPRNPVIAKACFMAGYIDTWGRGTLKIFSSCKEHGLPEPEIVEKDGGFQVALYKNPQDIVKGGQIGGQISGQIGGQIGENKIKNLTERQTEIFMLILGDVKITRKELSEKLGIAESAVQKHLKTLKTKMLIDRVGTKNGYWKILIDK